ncbi:MAG: lysophospholipase [Candidatus Eisenbacteria bacterium]|nr:lysophospholipase [Candidatus Eisenbacteria bacterium]
MNPANGDVPAIGIEVRVDRATVLPGRVWCAERPRAVIAVVHGLGDHSGRYAAFASDMVRARCTVVALDLPGHGEAPGPRGDMPSWVAVREQVLPAMFTAPRGLPDQPADLPRILLGHSMGAVLALDYALAHPRELLALVVSAPALRIPAPPWWKLTLANVARATAPSTGFANGLDPDGLSSDPEVVKAYREDPRVHDRISPRLYFAFNEARQRCLREARTLQVPTLILQGMADRIVDPKGALEFAGACPHGMMRFVTLKDVRHEPFNDTGREAVIRDLAAWLDAVLVV